MVEKVAILFCKWALRYCWQVPIHISYADHYPLSDLVTRARGGFLSPQTFDLVIINVCFLCKSLRGLWVLLNWPWLLRFLTCKIHTNVLVTLTCFKGDSGARQHPRIFSESSHLMKPFLIFYAWDNILKHNFCIWLPFWGLTYFPASHSFSWITAFPILWLHYFSNTRFMPASVSNRLLAGVSVTSSGIKNGDGLKK